MIDAPLLALTLRRVLPRVGEPNIAADSENMRQLTQLRWLAVLGQLVTLLVVDLSLDVALPLAAMLMVIGSVAAMNLFTGWLVRHRRITHAELLAAMLFDVGSLSVQLFLSGGASNPFVSLFLLQVVLGAILLARWASWVIVAVTSLAFALLVAHHDPLVYPPGLLPSVGGLNSLGHWVSFGLVATLLVLFVTRIMRNLRVRDMHLGDMRQQAAEEDHLVRMGLFASGAAHELGTPLATLSVILGDWQRMPRIAADPELAGEVGEMQGEVQRCKAIVTDILHAVGDLPGGAPERVEIHEFLADVVGPWRALHRSVPFTIDDLAPLGVTVAADPSLRQAIWNVLDNAVEASPHGISLTASIGDGTLDLSVGDRGPGLQPALLADFGRPHRSAKGAGHGVGLFLVASVMRRLGGSVTVANRPEGGAAVTLTLPLEIDAGAATA